MSKGNFFLLCIIALMSGFIISLLQRGCNMAQEKAKEHLVKGAEHVTDIPHQKQSETVKPKPQIVFVDTGSVVHDNSPIDSEKVVLAYLQLDSIRYYRDSLLDSTAKFMVEAWSRGEITRMKLSAFWKERQRSRVDTLKIEVPAPLPKLGHFYIGGGPDMAGTTAGVHASGLFVTRSGKVAYGLECRPQVPMMNMPPFISADVKFRIW